MKTAIIIGLGILTIAVDGIIMPALFHVHDISLLFIFLVALIVSQGFQPFVVGSGIVVAFIGELGHGFYLGTAILSWLVIIILWQLLTSFFNLRSVSQLRTIPNLILLSFLGVILTYLMELMFLCTARLAYNHTQSFDVFIMLLKDPFVWAEKLVSMVVIIILLNIFLKSPRSIQSYSYK